MAPYSAGSGALKDRTLSNGLDLREGSLGGSAAGATSDLSAITLRSARIMSLGGI